MLRMMKEAYLKGVWKVLYRIYHLNDRSKLLKNNIDLIVKAAFRKSQKSTIVNMGSLKIWLYSKRYGQKNMFAVAMEMIQGVKLVRKQLMQISQFSCHFKARF